MSVQNKIFWNWIYCRNINTKYKYKEIKNYEFWKIYTEKVLKINWIILDCFSIAVIANSNVKFNKITDISKNVPFPYREAMGSLIILIIIIKSDLAFIKRIKYSLQKNQIEITGMELNKYLNT